MEQDFDIKHWTNACPKYDCHKDNCKCGLKSVSLPAILGDDSKDSPIAPKNGAYCNAVVKYESNGHIYIYSKEGIPTLVETDGGNTEELIKKIEEDLAQEVLDREAADNALQEEIDDIKNSPDVVDIVATYAALQAYDTQHLGNNDVIRVLQDETHDGQSTYYRWDKQNSTWTYIGAVGDYYTKGQVDTLLAGKQDDLTAGSNISITQVDDDLVISATDTTYSNFVGTDGNTGGTAGLVPAPATTDVGKFLKADGTWDTAGGGEFVTLTDSDANWTDPDSGDDYIALWLLPTGKYMLDENATVQLLPGLTDYGGTLQVDYAFEAAVEPIALITNPQEQGTESDVTVFSSNQTMSFAVSYDTGEFSSTTILAQPFVGTDGQNDGIAGLVPVPTSGDADKFLKSDGTWDTAGSSITPVQTTGTSTTDVMSQNAVTSMIFADPEDKYRIRIGASALSGTTGNIGIGQGASAVGGGQNIALGSFAYAGAHGAIALGARSNASSVGQMDISSSQTSFGYNNSNYRLLTGLYDPQNAHDAANKEYVDNIVVNYATLTAAGAPTTSTAAVSVGQLYYDSTNDNYYYCSAIDTTDPQNPSYTWSALSTGGGGGPTVVQTTGTSQTDVMSQNAATSMIFANPGTNSQIRIGSVGNVSNYAVRIGYGGQASNTNAVAIGMSAQATGQSSVALGADTYTSHRGSVALGEAANTTVKGQIMVGTTNTYAGYNSTNYRIISGVHDGQSANDAVNVGQVNSVIDAINTALSTNIPHIGA